MARRTSAQASVIDRNPSLGRPADKPTLRYINSTMTGSMASGVTRSVSVLNTSNQDVTVMFTDGMAFDTRRHPMALDSEITIIVKYEATADTTVPWTQVMNNLPEEDLEFVRQLQNLYTGDPAEWSNRPRTIELHFVIDTAELEYCPAGIWVAPVSVHLVLTKFKDKVVLQPRTVDIRLEDFTSDERVSEAVTCATAYVVNDPNIVEPAFISTPFKCMSINPTYDPSRPEGIHHVLLGGNGSPDEKRVREYEYIPFEDFAKKGVYRTYAEFKASRDRIGKQYTKAELDKLYQQIEAYQQSLKMPDVKESDLAVQSLIDRKIFFGLSLKDMTLVFQELGKLSTAVEKVVNPK